MIDSYTMGCIVIDGHTYRRDLLILSGQVDATWWRVKAHELAVADLEDLLATPPDVLVVGTGQYGRLSILPETEQALAALNVQVISQQTEAACQTYNQLASEGRRVDAALHLTC
jgi:hypothetical protein